MDKINGIILAVIAGTCFAIQSPINSGLGKVITTKVASFHSVLTSTILMGTIILCTGGFKSYKNIAHVSPVYWIGGALGIVVVFLTAKLVPVLGATVTLSTVVSVEIIAGAIIDNLGILGVTKNPVSAVKIAGIALILVGVRLVVK